MTWFDLLVISLIGLSILFAAHRGLSREVITLLALAIGGVAALWLTGPVTGMLGNPSLLYTMAIAFALFAGFFFASLISKNLLIGKMWGKKPNKYDRIAGGVFGFLRGWLLVGLGFLALEYYFDADRQPKGFSEAALYGFAETAAHILEDLGLETTTPPPADTVSVDNSESGDTSPVQPASVEANVDF
jgi:uncharacterized membrane protein required for colicin V production